ncbi:MAG TPA: hypothetical protein PKE04_18075, partial [Clostridia bacterium]|nr:hypothetical protein [Clostridia bacterium]
SGRGIPLGFPLKLHPYNADVFRFLPPKMKIFKFSFRNCYALSDWIQEKEKGAKREGNSA